MSIDELNAHMLRKSTLYERHPHLVPVSGDTSPAGWAQIVADALEQIVALEQASGLRAQIAQIKPKWGTMRFYTLADPHRELDPERRRFATELLEIARAAQRRSAHACEECGAPSDLRRDGGFVFNGCECHSRGCPALQI